MEREPAVAGQFYTSEKQKLSSEIDAMLKSAKIEEKDIDVAVSYVAPHAGYMYSGAVQAYTYKALSMNEALGLIDTFVIIGPNHTGKGEPISISTTDWRTPFGTVKSDVELADELSWKSDILSIDEDAHEQEHSVEVQLPFLQKTVINPRCLFICMGNQSLDYCKTLTSAILDSSEQLKRTITVIASSDFNHYESAVVAKRKDMPAIDALKDLDYESFHRLIGQNDDSACGYGPITVAAMFAKQRGAKEGRLLKYATSGDVTKDYKSVVAYSSIVFV